MKKLLVPFLLAIILISCEKTGDLKYSETIAGGCALNKGASLKSADVSEIDKVT